MRRRLLVMLGVLTILGSMVTSSAFAGMTLNTIDDTTTLDGRQLTVTGPINCDASERLQLRATVTQRSTGAVAEGTTQFACTGDGTEGTTQVWDVRAVTRGAQTFELGSARACALAMTYDRSRATDAHQWCEEVELVAPAP